jgi:uncharacterized protein
MTSPGHRYPLKQGGPFERGVALFNRDKFFEAHEVWEEIWLAAGEPEKGFLQGLIQVAAAFHHAQRGNARGMESLLAAGLAKLGRFPGDHHGIGLAALCEEARRWTELLAEQSSGKRKYPKIRSAQRTVEKKAAREVRSEAASKRTPKNKTRKGGPRLSE